MSPYPDEKILPVWCRHSLPATGAYIASRWATNTAVRRGHEMKCARGVARARDAVDAVADADAGDETTDVVGQDDA